MNCRKNVNRLKMYCPITFAVSIVSLEMAVIAPQWFRYISSLPPLLQNCIKCHEVATLRLRSCALYGTQTNGFLFSPLEDEQLET